MTLWRFAAIGLLCLGGLGLSPHRAEAETMYSYASINYTTVSAPYTTEMSMSIDITLVSELDANLVDFDALPGVVSFTFFDGLVTVTEADTPFSFQVFHVSTDGTGAIIDWGWEYRKQTGPTTENRAESCGGGGTLPSLLGNCGALNFVQVAGDFTSLESAPGPGVALADTDLFGLGTWTITAVPEPGTALLLALGIAGLACRRPAR